MRDFEQLKEKYRRVTLVLSLILFAAGAVVVSAVSPPAGKDPLTVMSLATLLFMSGFFMLVSSWKASSVRSTRIRFALWLGGQPAILPVLVVGMPREPEVWTTALLVFACEGAVVTWAIWRLLKLDPEKPEPLGDLESYVRSHGYPDA